ncbi:MAG: hypothetical protein SFW07_04475 [Gammaproteobacteria bacterium]|nr:hypothetical protein [Gammaproteobacteria bacterium]
MSNELTKEKKRKKSEEEVLHNPFPTGVQEITVPLYNGVLEEEGRRVVDLSGENPADRVELPNVVSGEGHPEGRHKDSDYVGALTPVPLSPSVRASSWGTSSTSTSCSSSSEKQPSLEEEQCRSLRASSFGLGMFRPHTACGAALKTGKLNEVNPVRDYAWSAIFALAGLSCIIAGGAHGNVFLIIGGVLLIALSSALAVRADQSNSNDKQDSNSGISYFPQTSVIC